MRYQRSANRKAFGWRRLGRSVVVFAATVSGDNRDFWTIDKPGVRSDASDRPRCRLERQVVNRCLVVEGGIESGMSNGKPFRVPPSSGRPGEGRTRSEMILPTGLSGSAPPMEGVRGRKRALFPPPPSRALLRRHRVS